MVLISASEIYDFVDFATPDYDYTLSINVQGIIREEGVKNQQLHRADDNSREVCTLSSGSLFFVYWSWNQLSEADSGELFDLYHDVAKANGMARSFKWEGHDGHTYVVAFNCKFSREGFAVTKWGAKGISLEIIGKVA